MDIIEALSEARSLITTRSKWTTAAFARDDQGVRCAADSPLACQWCASGALEKVVPPEEEHLYREAHSLLDWVAISHGYEGTFDLNDNLTHIEVLRFMDEAIQCAKHIVSGAEVAA